MKYECHNIFMIRVPAFSSWHVLNYLNSSSSAKEYIIKHDLEDIFLESLLISSQTLYHSYVDSQGIENKKKINKSLASYLLRASGRATPFGTWASVGLGKWGENNSIVINSKENIKKVKVDELWMAYIIFNLEKNLDVLYNLRLKINSNIYSHGDRIKNPFCSNHGILGTEKHEEILLQSHMRKTGLIDFLLIKAKEFVSCSILIDNIVEKYAGISKKLVDDTLLALLENEILITSLHLPTFCEDPLQHVILTLKQENCKIKTLYELEELKEMIEQYQNSFFDTHFLQKIYDKMSGLYKADNYLKINSGIILEQNFLTKDIKNILENFVDKFSKLTVDQLNKNILKKFKEKIFEKYGPNIDVPLYEIIDEKLFNGLSYFNFSKEWKDSERDLKIKSVFDNKILEAYLKCNDEINLHLTDFEFLKLEKEDVNCGSSFDLNVLIFNKCKNQYKIVMGSSLGSTSAGKMFQRFSEVYDQNLFYDYNKIYQEVIDVTEADYNVAEIRETPTSGRLANIISTNKLYSHYIALGNTESNPEGEILFSDLAIGIRDNKQLYIKSLKTDKIIKVTTNHMLNVSLGSKIQRLLIAISEDYESFPLSRILFLHNNTYSYFPRIIFEEVIIYPKMWLLAPAHFNLFSLESFQTDFSDYRNCYHMDSVLYLVDRDNRLIIDVRKKEFQEIIFELLQKQQQVTLREVEDKSFNESLASDENQKQYLAEYVFSFVAKERKKTKLFNKKSYMLQNENYRYFPTESGWIYFKLYGIDNRETELLTKLLKSALEQLQPKLFFFIRYYDEQNHLRVRFKYDTSEQAGSSISFLTTLFCQWREKGVVGKVVFDTYELEVNRYGGIELIEELHNVFYWDSLWVIAMLENFKVAENNDREIVYIVGMISAFLSLSDSINELFLVLDDNNLRNSNKMEFKKERLKFLKWFENIKNDDLEEIDIRFTNSKKIYLGRQKAYQKFFYKMKKQANLSNSTSNILLSLVHMFCNRTTGILNYESHYLSLIRHTVYNFIEKEKHMPDK